MADPYAGADARGKLRGVMTGPGSDTLQRAQMAASVAVSNAVPRGGINRQQYNLPVEHPDTLPAIIQNGRDGSAEDN